MALVKKTIQNHVVESNLIENLLKPTNNFIVGNYQTTTPKDTTISSEIYLPGLVIYDPNSSVNIAARISGRIEKMYVNYKYQRVAKGQKLFDLYSPELLTEQQNFIYLISNDSDNRSIIKASKQKLLLYGMTVNQINSLASAKRANPVISIYSPAYGIIQATENRTGNANITMQNATATTEFLTIKEGDYIKKGEIVFKLVNTDKVWGVFNVLQGYNNLIKTNQSIAITSELDENEFITAKVNFIETQLSPTDKSNRIRVYLNNNILKLPIGTRLQGILKTNPIKAIWLQKQALVSIGNKKIVFIKRDNGFKATAIKTGIEINDFIQIIEGISVEDTIAKNAEYLIDSESFIKTQLP
ncbi:efflux RND transporter periplasmic adaptor subunit [Flavobacterium sp. ZS1P14]|uniref:efflux RND transporter periplasmic adaptor subunit n=1 Tax=Flavobacterium sp. ZS1P14 TaxID=3401729 RepID=UPI003AB09DB7